MSSRSFVDLSSALIQAMGQRLEAAKPTEEGLSLTTGDGFLYLFVENPNEVSLAEIDRLFEPHGAPKPVHVVVLTPGHLPLALSEEVVRRHGTLVEGARFTELARQLGLESMLGEAPQAPHRTSVRLLPSAQQLDQIMHRARTWLDWGVPALALRFYRQAADLKPGFLPARVGIGRALLALGLVADAERTFDEVLKIRPDDVDARLGKAAVYAARSQSKQEVEMYRRLLEEDQARNEVRAHLVAALVDIGDWPAASVEIEALLAQAPEQPQLRFLHSVALAKAGKAALAEEERAESRRLGLSYEQESSLCRHLGIPLPPAPKPVAVRPTTPAARSSSRGSRNAGRPAPRTTTARRKSAPPRRAAARPRSPGRKRK